MVIYRDRPSQRPASGRISLSSPTEILKAESLCLSYGKAQVVHDLDLCLNEGVVTALCGANGSGKTTTLMGLAGWLPCSGGRLLWKGSAPPKKLSSMARSGLALIPDERSVFASLSAEANLRLGRGDLDFAYDTFPELKDLRDRRAGLLSGGEQQILTLARALSRKPKVLMVDELSLGLSPIVVSRLLSAIRNAANEGLAVLLVEQRIDLALGVADRCIVLQHGRVAMEGDASHVLGRLGDLQRVYLDSKEG